MTLIYCIYTLLGFDTECSYNNIIIMGTEWTHAGAFLKCILKDLSCDKFHAEYLSFTAYHIVSAHIFQANNIVNKFPNINATCYIQLYCYETINGRLCYEHIIQHPFREACLDHLACHDRSCPVPTFFLEWNRTHACKLTPMTLTWAHFSNFCHDNSITPVVPETLAWETRAVSEACLPFDYMPMC